MISMLYLFFMLGASCKTPEWVVDEGHTNKAVEMYVCKETSEVLAELRSSRSCYGSGRYWFAGGCVIHWGRFLDKEKARERVEEMVGAQENR